ncbi:MAG TPA: ATP-binding protein [Desulfuromonadales bacterium]|nr:ATP-binding protein [Desulfuromonadales bacterium]
MNQEKILIVEDEPELAEVLSYQLQHQGFTTLVAGDGLNGCRLAGNEQPALILLDVLLPDLDGWEVCRLIRSRHEHQIGSVPIIMLTALDSLNDRLKGLEAGADAYISKPYSIREVILTARRLMERRQREQTLKDAMSRMQERSNNSVAIQDILCHELRNQLLILKGFSGLLGRNETFANQHSQNCLQAIERSTQSLGNLAESLLLLSRHESEGLSLPPDHPAVADLATEILDLYRPFADQQRLEFHLHLEQTDPTPSVNSIGLRVILSNLIENAVKYVPAGTEINVFLRTPERTRLEVTVEDAGPGIPEENRDKIFQRFFRGAPPVGKLPGSGLGLYITRTLAKAMGGDACYEPVKTGGSRFVVTFPALQ